MFRFRTSTLSAFSAILAAAVLVPTSAGAAVLPAAVHPVADYQLQTVRTSTVAGAPALTDIGNNGNTFATETVDGASHTVLTFALHHGLTMTPTTVLAAPTQYTIVILARLHAVSGYRRLVDFKHGSSDTGLYDNSGVLEFYSSAAGTKTPIKANQYFQVVLTRTTATKTVVGYVNGVQQFSFKDTARYGVIDAKNTLRFFADDHATTGEDSAGAVARIRVYNAVLSATQVAALDREPS